MKIPKPSVASKSFKGLKGLLEENAISLPPCRVSIPVQEIELGPEREEGLFQEAMAGVNPISRENCVERILVFRPAEKEAPQKSGRQEDAEALSRLTRLVKEGEGFEVEDTPEYIEGTSYDVPAEIAGRLHQGRYSIQAHLDLHGMNAQDAKTVFERDGRMPVIIESTRIVAKEVGEKVFIASLIMGPLNCAAQIRGIENLLLDFYDRPAFVEELLSFTVQLGGAYGKALIEAGANCIQIGEALSSPTVISPSFYRNFVRDKERKLIQDLHACGAENTILHICGNISKILEDCASTGADIIDIDWMMDISGVIEAKAIRDAKITARGNLNPIGVLLSDTPEDVFFESKKLIEKNIEKGRFILSAGCNMQPGSVPENVRAMVKAAEMFGNYSA